MDRPAGGGSLPRLIARWLAHYQAAARPEEPDGALGGDGRPAEGSGYHGVKGLPERRPAGGVLRSSLDDGHLGQVQGGNRLPQEATGALTGFEEGQLELGTVGGDNQAGKAAPAAEVQHPALLRQTGQQGAAVFDVTVNGTGAEKAEVLRPEEKRVEVGRQEEPARALMTTRRRGSSPSEMVPTPSISFTMS